MGVRSGLLRVAAKGAWLVSVLSYLASVGLEAANKQDDEAATELVAVAIQNLSFVAIATLALLILRSQPENKVAWAIMLAGVVFPVEAFIAQLTEYALNAWGQVGITLLAGWVSRWIWIGATLPVPLILLFYPDGMLPSSRWKPVVFIVLSIVAITWVFSAFDPTPMEEFTGLRNPVGIETLLSSFTMVVGIAFWGLAILPLLAAVSLIPRYRRSRGVERQQMKLIAWVGAVSVFFFLILDTVFQLDPVADAITNTLFTLYVGAAITAGIVRYKVFEIDRIISRSISYTIVVAVLGAVFAVGVVGIPNVLGLKDSPAMVAVSTLAVAGLFNPMRRRIQTTVNRRFNRSKYQADQVAEEFAARLRRPLTAEQLGDLWVETVNTYFEPASSGIWLNARGITGLVDSRSDPLIR